MVRAEGPYDLGNVYYAGISGMSQGNVFSAGTSGMSWGMCLVPGCLGCPRAMYLVPGHPQDVPGMSRPWIARGN